MHHLIHSPPCVNATPSSFLYLSVSVCLLQAQLLRSLCGAISLSQSLRSYRLPSVRACQPFTRLRLFRPRRRLKLSRGTLGGMSARLPAPADHSGSRGGGGRSRRAGGRRGRARRGPRPRRRACAGPPAGHPERWGRRGEGRRKGPPATRGGGTARPHPTSSPTSVPSSILFSLFMSFSSPSILALAHSSERTTRFERVSARQGKGGHSPSRECVRGPSLAMVIAIRSGRCHWLPSLWLAKPDRHLPRLHRMHAQGKCTRCSRLGRQAPARRGVCASVRFGGR